MNSKADSQRRWAELSLFVTLVFVLVSGCFVLFLDDDNQLTPIITTVLIGTMIMAALLTLVLLILYLSAFTRLRQVKVERRLVVAKELIATLDPKNQLQMLAECARLVMAEDDSEVQLVELVGDNEVVVGYLLSPQRFNEAEIDACIVDVKFPDATAEWKQLVLRNEA